MANAQGNFEFDKAFLEMRWRCLSLAADLDRVQRISTQNPQSLPSVEPHLQKLRKAIGVLLEENSDRAERVQMIYSDTTPPVRAIR